MKMKNRGLSANVSRVKWGAPSGFGSNNHREDAPHLMVWSNFRPLYFVAQDLCRYKIRFWKLNHLNYHRGIIRDHLISLTSNKECSKSHESLK